jgi:hypothetical protein
MDQSVSFVALETVEDFPLILEHRNFASLKIGDSVVDFLRYYIIDQKLYV